VRVTLEGIIGPTGLFTDGDWVESKDQDPNGSVRLIQLADVGDGNFIDKSSRYMNAAKAKELKCTYLEPGDILIARMPDPVGRACIFPGLEQSSVTVVDVCILRPDLQRVCPRWLLHKINSEDFRRAISSWITGATRQRISRGNLSKLEFTLPSLAEQRRIAAVLDRADEIRLKRMRALALIDTLTQSIFLKMFGDPVTNPQRFDLANLEDVVTAVVDCPHTTPNWTNSGKIALRTSNLTEGGWNWSDTRYVSDKEFHARSARAYVKPGDIVLSREGTVGVAAIVEDEMEVCLGQRLVQIRMQNAIVRGSFLLSYLLYELAPKRISRIMVGATSTHLNLKDLRKMRVPVPPNTLQETYDRKIKIVDRLKRRFLSASDNIDLLFSSLQHRAFSGQL
jgi:type I restriction enzyme S subunit